MSITGFEYKDVEMIVWNKAKWLESYYWVFNEDGHGTGICLTLTFQPRPAR